MINRNWTPSATVAHATFIPPCISRSLSLHYTDNLTSTAIPLSAIIHATSVCTFELLCDDESSCMYHERSTTRKRATCSAIETIETVTAFRDTATELPSPLTFEANKLPSIWKPTFGSQRGSVPWKSFRHKTNFQALARPTPLSRNGLAANKVASKFQGSSANDPAEDRVSWYR